MDEMLFGGGRVLIGSRVEDAERVITQLIMLATGGKTQFSDLANVSL